jgi:cytochrome c-type biogenesis protein
MEVSIPLAFLAGLVSFLSPCVFALVPAYIGYLSGRSVAFQKDNLEARKIDTLLHGLAFVLGFSLVFISLGIAASALGAVLYDLRSWLAKIGGFVVFLFGLHMSGIFRIKYLEYDLRPRSSDEMQRSYVSSALMGVFFSAGWSPCVGPVLGAILTLAARGGNVAQGMQLLTAYSAGLAIPFLGAAFGVGWVTTILKKYQKTLHIIEIGMGVVLMIVGVMLFFGVFETMARFGWFVDFGI